MALLVQSPPWMENIYSAPPEIAARLLQDHLDPDRAKRAAQLEEVFRLAGQARMPYPLMAQAPPDSLAGRQMEARFTRLDGLTLQVEAIMTMMSVNPARGRDMALSLAVPAPPPPGCDQAAAPILDKYYGLALMMARRGFTAKQREDGDHLRYMLRIIAASTSPEQLQGAATLVRQYEGTAEEEGALLAALAASLRLSAANPRAYAATPALEAQMGPLRRRPGMEDAWQAYVKTQTSAKPCEGTGSPVFWEAGTGAELFKASARLHPVPAKADSDYEARILALLHRVEEYREDDEMPPMGVFHMRSSLYLVLLNHSITPELQRQVISSFVQFLRDAPAKLDSPAEWMLVFQKMILPTSPGGMAAVAIAREEIRRGGDGVMNLLVDTGMAF